MSIHLHGFLPHRALPGAKKCGLAVGGQSRHRDTHQSEDSGRQGTRLDMRDLHTRIAILTEGCYDWDMIHRFSVSNYHSIREEAVLDLRIPGTAPDLSCFRRSVARPDVRLPAVVVLMGPNGSGKTTLLRALVIAAEIASTAPLNGPSKIGAIFPFLSEHGRNAPTRICIEFEVRGLLSDETPELFRYELIVERTETRQSTKARFRYETLQHFPRGRARRLFERGAANEPIYVSKEFGLRSGDDRLKAVRADASVISTLAMFNVPLAVRVVDWLQTLKAWSTNIVGLDTGMFPTEAITDMYEDDGEDEEDGSESDWLRSRIQCTDLGIRGIKVRDGSDGTKLVLFDHHGLDMPVPLSLESSGTKNLFHLLPQIRMALKSTGLAVLDEIDGDLHVDIVGEILSWFRTRETNPRDAQLLITTHHVGLLDDLEKEEIFLVEKDDSGATRVHGAQDVRGLRRDVSLYAKYRGGVLGGLPRIG